MEIVISKDNPIPLHIQLLNEIRHGILSGRWPAGSPLLSEHDLQTRLSISRNTIRQALNAARAEGLIETVPGKGTYVSLNPARPQGSHLIGFVIPYFHGSFDTLLLQGAEDALGKEGYRIVFCISHYQIEEEERVLRQLLQERVAGFLIWPMEDEKEHRFLVDLIRQKHPVVLMDRTFPGLDTDLVLCDNFRGGYAATRHLIDLGHRQIAFLARTHSGLLPITERLRGYQQALLDAGLAPLPLLEFGARQDFANESLLHNPNGLVGEVNQQLCDYISTPGHASAIFAMNDLMALQALQSAGHCGLRVPEQLSVVGFDNLAFVNHLPKPLTTVAQDPYAIGQEAAKLLYYRMMGGIDQPRRVVLPTRLVERATTAPPAREP